MQQQIALLLNQPQQQNPVLARVFDLGSSAQFFKAAQNPSTGKKPSPVQNRHDRSDVRGLIQDILDSGMSPFIVDRDQYSAFQRLYPQLAQVDSQHWYNTCYKMCLHSDYFQNNVLPPGPDALMVGPYKRQRIAESLDGVEGLAAYAAIMKTQLDSMNVPQEVLENLHILLNLTGKEPGATAKFKAHYKRLREVKIASYQEYWRHDTSVEQTRPPVVYPGIELEPQVKLQALVESKLADQGGKDLYRCADLGAEISELAMSCTQSQVEGIKLNEDFAEVLAWCRLQGAMGLVVDFRAPTYALFVK